MWKLETQGDRKAEFSEPALLRGSIGKKGLEHRSLLCSVSPAWFLFCLVHGHIGLFSPLGCSFVKSGPVCSPELDRAGHAVAMRR